MTLCDFCEKEIDRLAYECNYCDCSHCQSHRLPETHECSKIAQAVPPESRPEEAEVLKKSPQERKTTEFIDLTELKERADMEPQPYSVVEADQTVGTSPEPDYDTAPDVAIDGSIREDELGSNEKVQSEGETAGASSRTGFVAVFIILILLLVGVLFVVI